MDQSFLLEVKGRIAYVTLNRPEKHNAIDLAMLKASIVTCRRIKRDKKIRVVIITGEGPSFCSGLDFPSVMARPARILPHFLKAPWRRTNNFQAFAWQWRSLSVPVIAAIRGSCFGGGLQLALAADLRFATPDARLSVMEVKWGLIPDMTGTLSLRQLLREDQAKDLVFSGRIVDGIEAEKIGLVTKLSTTPREEAKVYAERLLDLSPDSLALSKKLLQKNSRGSECAALRRERFYELHVLATPNYRIALDAGLKKTKPTFRDRFW